ncbi:MAG: chemotaxis protein CheW [Melioribacteraceae bacterium]|jgi:purine-binding chemotaxis protein CheW|nr:chemotaxis protein CheW [Melioribacteraceae bacterium]
MSDIETNTDSSIIQLVGFKLATGEYGVDILKVQEIHRMLAITDVPNSPEFIEGVVNLRGRIIPVIDLRIRLNLPKIKHDNNTRIIVVDLEGKTVGFVVDEVSEVLRIPSNVTEPPPDLVVSGVDSGYISSVAKLEDRLLILLDLKKVLTFEEIEVLEEV